ncbi:MAG: Nif3-like dinuclear metal center hexameric protein, partial [Nitrosospira sp.]|nr:Nif3-like dinuclear metal center hexameric protein [Nitrosospira sp.]MBI0407416.1 Nif3-like dinuclear metal center hexameric protein [Nitrosospira sp.]MBI0414903.1 Nif3-like dinuclear metal center hexameric protein [Nitrosospira sp.]MBI0415737.1 Nif3-like dinuclear metal center hexameric protein [Nitrosospira sp.]MBI0417497.1 Nif3-like dinuclear metal center hexameric protein [Nitrosospira sp.]
MKLSELKSYLDQLLNVSHFHDYCPNGLQVEGRNEIYTVITGVTASLNLLQAAVAANADLILVHHGYFWRGENECVVGMKRHRIALLIENNINLLAYHLPLDAHSVLGNNAQLGCQLDFIESGRFGEQNIAMLGHLSRDITLEELGVKIERVLSRTPLIIGDKAGLIRRIAWCTGAAESYFNEAIRLNVDVFITGEISERNVHVSRECGVGLISAGHHATERYGVKALGEHIAQKFGITHQFIDENN